MTAGGLVFIGGATDSRIRAFDLEDRDRKSGARTCQPAGTRAPVVYRGAKSGRQYVAIAAGGGGKFSRTISDAVVAFALP